MPTNRDEIIAEIEQHIHKFGGGLGEWCIGIAKDPRGPFFHNHLVADLRDGLIYREAFTPSAAQAIRDHFVNDCGLELDLEDAPEPGKIVFVYRRTAPDPSLSGGGVAGQPTPKPNHSTPRAA